MAASLTIRWSSAARIGALGLVLVGALALIAGTLEQPAPPSLPPDVGLGPSASSPVVPSPAGGDRSGGSWGSPWRSRRRDDDPPRRGHQPRPGRDPAAKPRARPAQREEREDDPPAAPAPVAAVQPPPPAPVAAPQPTPSPPPAPSQPASTPDPQPPAEFGFEK